MPSREVVGRAVPSWLGGVPGSLRRIPRPRAMRSRRLRKNHPRMTWKQITRRCTGTATSREKGVVVFNPGSISVTRYRYRGARIPNPQGIPASVDPSSLRVYCASREEQRSRVGVQQAPA